MSRGEAVFGVRVALLCLLCFLAPGCLVQHHAIPAAGARQNRPLMTATKDQLIERIRETSDPIGSFLLRADLSPAVINPSKGVVTEYATIGAYILFRRPNDLRYQSAGADCGVRARWQRAS